MLAARLAACHPRHQVIAAETYRQLPPNLQKKVAEILKAHLGYEKWEKSFTSESATLDLLAD